MVACKKVHGNPCFNVAMGPGVEWVKMTARGGGGVDDELSCTIARISTRNNLSEGTKRM